MLGVGATAAGAIALVIRARRRRHQHPPPPKSLREKLRIREATPNDAARIIQWVRHINAERNPYLIMEPGEFTMTEEKERNFLQERRVSPNSVFLLGFVGGDGNDGEEEEGKDNGASDFVLLGLVVVVGIVCHVAKVSPNSAGWCNQTSPVQVSLSVVVTCRARARRTPSH